MAVDEARAEPVWPIEKPLLAALVGCGLSDPRIGACFSVDQASVRRLREHYHLDGQQPDMAPEDILNELSNATQAAMSYAGAALKCVRRQDTVDAKTTFLLEKALEQLSRIGRAYGALQRNHP